MKARLAEAAKQRGANAVGGFEYGQRAHRWWQLFAFRWDTESWYGRGDALLVAAPDDTPLEPGA